MLRFGVHTAKMAVLRQIPHRLFVPLRCARVVPLSFKFIRVDWDLFQLCHERVNQADLPSMTCSYLWQCIKRRARDQIFSDNAKGGWRIRGLRFFDKTFYFF